MSQVPGNSRSLGATADFGDDSRLAAALKRYCEIVDDGRTPDRDALLAEFPDVDDSLLHCLEAIDFVRDCKRQTESPARGPSDISPLATIGDFRIVRELGRGGMGVVYEAEQLSLGRQVALKVLPFAAVADEQALQRFKNEARAAATLHHPHIVPVHSVGMERGIHFYTMQFINGPTLAEVIAELKQSVGQSNHQDERTQPHAESTGNRDHSEETCREFQAGLSTKRQGDRAFYHRTIAQWGIDAGEALAYAHESGVIHRDIKPSNLLVDSVGHLWVTDFGLARLEQDATMTMSGAILGTLRYMAPEQALGKRVAIDQRADVYSLGVTLYELLTLQHAYDGTTREELLKQVAFEDAPPLRKVDSSIPVELETIVGKAMQKNPDDRYLTASELADDLQRYLDNRPIQARPPTLLDRLTKLARRHRGITTTAAGALLLILFLLAGSVVVLNATNRQLEVANKKEKTAREKAEALAEEKDALAQRNETVLDYFVSAFDSADLKNEGVTTEMTALQVLEKALENLEQDATFEKDELAKADLLSSIGASLSSLGHYEQAIRAKQEALGIRQDKLGNDHDLTLKTMTRLADDYSAVGDRDEAIELCESALRLAEGKYGKNHPDTCVYLHKLSSGYVWAGRLQEALLMKEKTYELSKTKWGEQHPETLGALQNLAVVYLRLGRSEEAVSLLEEVLDLAELDADHPFRLNGMGVLAWAYSAAGRLDEAISLSEEVLSLRIKKFGRDHPETIGSMNGLASAYFRTNQMDMALPLYEEALEGMRDRLGETHEFTLVAMNNVAATRKAMGRLDEAIPLSEECLELSKDSLGKWHPQTLYFMHVLADGYVKAGRIEEAGVLFEEGLIGQQNTIGRDHPDTLNGMGGLATVYRDLGRLEEAIQLQAERVELSTNRFGRRHRHATRAIHDLATTYQTAGRWGPAISLLEEILEIRRAELGDQHEHTILTIRTLASSYRVTGRLTQAIPLYREALQLRKQAPEDRHSDTLSIIRGLQAALLEAREFEEAKQHVEDWIRMLKNADSLDKVQLARAEVALAEALLASERYEEAMEYIESAFERTDIDDLQRLQAQSIKGALFAALDNPAAGEPLLVDSAEQLMEQLPEITIGRRWHVPRACQRVINLYEGWDRPHDADQWMAKLGEVNAQIELLRNASVSE